MDDDEINIEIWYCNYCKIILTNGNVKWLVDGQKQDTIQRLLIFSRVSAYGSLKTKKKSKSKSPKVSAAAYGNVRLRECKNTEFIWELKLGFKQGGR